MAPKAAKKADAKAAKADKPKVKRAPSPYIIFCSEKRPDIKISHPDASFGETGKLLGQMWAAIDEKTKAVSSGPSFSPNFSSWPSRTASPADLSLPPPPSFYPLLEIRGRLRCQKGGS
jgi:hypothetical protein